MLTSPRKNSYTLTCSARARQVNDWRRSHQQQERMKSVDCVFTSLAGRWRRSAVQESIPPTRTTTTTMMKTIMKIATQHIHDTEGVQQSCLQCERDYFGGLSPDVGCGASDRPTRDTVGCSLSLCASPTKDNGVLAACPLSSKGRCEGGFTISQKSFSGSHLCKNPGTGTG